MIAVDIANNLLVSGAATITSDLTVNGGDITLGGTGRIQGIDTVSASTDAANKNYVDSNFAQRYSFNIGSSGGARRYIKLWTMTDTDDGVSGFLSMSGDYGDNDKGAYQLLVGTRSGNISMDVFETSIGGITDNFEFFYKDIGTSYEIWMLASDYNYPGQTAFIPVATFGGVTYNFDSITTTAPSGLVSVPNISFVNTVTAQNIAGAKTFTSLVSGITPTAAANFVTKAYVDGSGGGTGPFLPLAGGTLTGAFYAEGSLPTTPGMSGTGIGLGQASNYAHAQFSGSAGGYIDFSEPNVDWSGRIIYTHSSDSMVFYTATTAVLTLDSSNNATFAGNISVADDINITNAGGVFLFTGSGYIGAADNFYVGGATTGTDHTYIGDTGRNVSIYNSAVFTVESGDVRLLGTGRIQGIDTVSVGTDAANKAYVDTTASGAANWASIGAGTRTNYDLGFQPPSTGYAGFFFNKSDGNGAGYFLVRGGADSDVYKQGGITLVGDGGTLTIATRTSASNVIRFMTGASPVERLNITGTGAFSFGNSLTNYGTSGQVMTSNGNATPGWTTINTGVLSVSDDGGSTINVSGSSTARVVAAVTGAVSLSSANLATGAQIQTAINTAVTGVLKYDGVGTQVQTHQHYQVDQEQ